MRPGAKKPATPKQAAPTEKRPAGRPALHTPELATAVCQELMEGKSLRAICALPQFPSIATVMRWLADDTGQFCAQYARAREVQAELYAEEVITLADTVLHAVKRKVTGKGKKKSVEETFGDAVERSRLMVDARKWYASKLAPKRYGMAVGLGGEGETVGLLVIAKDLTGRKD